VATPLLLMVEKEPVKTLLSSDKLAKEDVPSLQYPAMKYVGLEGVHRLVFKKHKNIKT
jgi:hypothetical protein